MVKLHWTVGEPPTSLGRHLLRDHGAELAHDFGSGPEVRESLDAVEGLNTTVRQDVQRVGQELARRGLDLWVDVHLPVEVAELLDLSHALQPGRVEEGLVPETEVLGPQ